tara:strand:+ start:84 stop:197 length:114 start_codon:yes stop_codon:yes gene_type:complete
MRKGKKLQERLLLILMITVLVGIATLAFIAIKDGYAV